MPRDGVTDKQHVVLKHIPGKMRVNGIHILSGGKVQAAHMLADLSRARIVFRSK